MSVHSSSVSMYLSVVLVSDDSSSVQRKAPCIFHSCNSLKFSMAEIQIIDFLPKPSFFSIVPYSGICFLFVFLISPGFFFPLSNASEISLTFLKCLFLLFLLSNH